jgi:hypothetical protein
MPSYTFSIDSMHVNFQRSSIDASDSDWLVFSVKFGLLSRHFDDQVGTGIVSNTKLTPANAQKPWVVDLGDINVGDSDSVFISLVMNNLSHSDTRQQQAEALKIVGAVGSALKGANTGVDLSQIPGVGIVVGEIPFTTAASLLIGEALGVVTELGPVIAAIGELIGGTDTPNCNGLVFEEFFTLSGKQLRDLTKNSTVAFTETKTFADQQSPHECGASPITEVVISITPNPGGFDLNRFLRAKGFDPSRGIRQVLPNVASFSVKDDLINDH